MSVPGMPNENSGAAISVPRWEHFEHFADVGVRGIGRTPDEAFEQAALGLTGVVTDPALVVPEHEVEIRCSAPDLELLLIEWLNAVIYQMAVGRMLFGRFSVVINGLELRGVARGEPVDPVRHQPAVEVKGATYTALKVAQAESGLWVAQCVVDV